MTANVRSAIMRSSSVGNRPEQAARRCLLGFRYSGISSARLPPMSWRGVYLLRTFGWVRDYYGMSVEWTPACTMIQHHVKYLLVGAGLAAATAARSIRERDAEGSILLVGQENSRPYHRPPLSKEFLRRTQSRESIFVVEPDWFSNHHVDLRTGRRVARLDVVRGAGTLDNGEEVSYDRLLLATGATPAQLDCPGAALPNIFHLRNLEDVDRLHIAIDQARSASPAGGRVAVIGAGFLGVEVAASLAQLGLHVDLLCSQSHPWDHFAGEITGKFLQLHLERHGVTVHADARPQRLEGDGRVQRVVVDDDSIACDFAVACVGASVNKELLRGTPIAASRAILVDEQCRTNIPTIYAAGDCCAIFDPLFGKHRQMDHWDNAQVTGALAGRNMAGAGESYRGVNHFFSEIFGLSMAGWGEARLVDRRLVRAIPRGESGDLIEIGIAADGRVAQILSLHAAGGSADEVILREIVQRRIRLEGNEERLKDPAFPISELLA